MLIHSFAFLAFFTIKFLTLAYCDAAEPWQLGFQDAATPIMQGIIDLHHDIFFFLILILVSFLVGAAVCFVILKMQNRQSSGSRGALSRGPRQTAGASSSGAGSSAEDKKKDDLRKKVMRKGGGLV